MARKGERGHLMAGLMVAVAILVIFSTVAVQAWDDVLRRDAEAEMIFRAEEYARAIQRFRKDQGRLPTKLEELAQSGSRGQYFIRRLYEDPLVKDGKWGLLYAAPGGGILDPNAPEQQATGKLGQITHQPGQPLGGLTGRFGKGPKEVAGLPIAGVKSLCKKKPFRVLRGSSDYSRWLFSIFDLERGGTQIPGMKPSPRTKGRPGGGRPARGGMPGGRRR